jgi:hypothetical protein
VIKGPRVVIDRADVACVSLGGWGESVEEHQRLSGLDTPQAGWVPSGVAHHLHDARIGGAGPLLHPVCVVCSLCVGLFSTSTTTEGVCVFSKLLFLRAHDEKVIARHHGNLRPPHPAGGIVLFPALGDGGKQTLHLLALRDESSSGACHSENRRCFSKELWRNGSMGHFTYIPLTFFLIQPLRLSFL